MMALSGVRSSWAHVRENWLLALLASSAWRARQFADVVVQAHGPDRAFPRPGRRAPPRPPASHPCGAAGRCCMAPCCSTCWVMATASGARRRRRDQFVGLRPTTSGLGVAVELFERRVDDTMSCTVSRVTMATGLLDEILSTASVAARPSTGGRSRWPSPPAAPGRRLSRRRSSGPNLRDGSSSTQANAPHRGDTRSTADEPSPMHLDIRVLSRRPSQTW